MRVKAFSDSLLSKEYEEHPGVFLSDRQSDVNYERFILHSKRACMSLQALLKREQNIVFLISGNSSLYVTFLFALNYLRQIVMPISPEVPLRELEELVETYRPALILAENSQQVTSFAAPCLGLQSLAQDTSVSVAQFPLIEHLAEDICFIMLTSGSRRASKGVVLTNSNILSDVAGIQGYMHLSSNDRCLVVRSLTHASALVGELLLTAMTGGTCVLRHTPPTLQRLFTWCEQQEITWLGLPPILLEGLVRIGIRRKLKLPVRRVVVSGSILSPDLCLEFCDTFPDVELVNAYGLTEASPRVSYLPPALARTKPGSVGFAIEGCRVRVVGGDQKECAPGELGQVQIAGSNVMPGYFPLNNVPTRVSADAWLNTGDEGYIDSDGCLFIMRRLDSVIVHRGINISPEHVSAVIEECDGVISAEVSQISHSGLGSRLVAFVQTHSSADRTSRLEQIREYLNLNLDQRKHPEEFVFVEAFPTTSSGKVLVKKLVADYLEGRGFRIEED